MKYSDWANPKLSVLLCLLLIFTDPANAGESVFSFVEWEIRSAPVLAFFPLGGNAPKKNLLTTYMIGPSLDLYNLNYSNERLSLLNLSGYIVGFNPSAFGETSKAQFSNEGYFRVGPHYRSKGFWKGRLSLGSQFGYGLVSQKNTEKGKSQFLHGPEVSFTLSWNEYNQPTPLDEEEVAVGAMASYLIVVASGMGWIINQIL